MERCPPEIWLIVFSYACMDDGSTGRALSLVSRFFNSTSRSTKLQSLAIKGVHQLSGLAGTLERSLPQDRAVQYLSVRVHTRDMNKRSASVEDGTILRGKGGLDTRGPSMHTAIQDKPMLLLSHILQTLAPTLRIIHLSLPISSPSRLLPATLPVIAELHLSSNDMRGQHLDARNIQSEPQCYPSLKRLRLGMLHHHHELFGHIAQMAPALVHLRFCIPEHTYFYRDFERALGRADDAPSTPSEEFLPRTVERVSVQMGPVPNARTCPGWASMYDQTRLSLERIARTDGRVKLMKHR